MTRHSSTFVAVQAVVCFVFFPVKFLKMDTLISRKPICLGVKRILNTNKGKRSYPALITTNIIVELNVQLIKSASKLKLNKEKLQK